MIVKERCHGRIPSIAQKISCFLYEKGHIIMRQILGTKGIQGMNERGDRETKANSAGGSQDPFLLGGHKKGERLRERSSPLVKPDPIRVSGIEASPMPERRLNKRADTVIPLTIKLWGLSTPPPPITVETDNISFQGLSLAIKIKTQFEQGRFSIPGGEDSIKMAQYLVLENKRLELGINIRPHGESIHAMGLVKWYNRWFRKGLYYLKAGVFFEEMEKEDKEEWLEFLKTIYHFMVGLGYR